MSNLKFGQGTEEQCRKAFEMIKLRNEMDLNDELMKPEGLDTPKRKEKKNKFYIENKKLTFQNYEQGPWEIKQFDGEDEYGKPFYSMNRKIPFEGGEQPNPLQLDDGQE